MTAMAASRRPRASLRSAFTLIELLITVILMATVSLIVARLFRSTMHVIGDAPAAQNAIVRTDAMIRQLRADAWGAADVAAPSVDRTDLQVGGGKTIHWSV